MPCHVITWAIDLQIKWRQYIGQQKPELHGIKIGTIKILSQNTSIYFNTSCLLATFVSIETATSPNSAISSFSRSSLKNRTNVTLTTWIFLRWTISCHYQYSWVPEFLSHFPTKAKARDNTPHRDNTRHRENTRQRGNTCYRHQFLKKMSRLSLILSPAVQTLDSTIERISIRRNNCVRYTLDSDLSSRPEWLALSTLWTIGAWIKWRKTEFYPISDLELRSSPQAFSTLLTHILTYAETDSFPNFSSRRREIQETTRLREVFSSFSARLWST